MTTTPTQLTLVSSNPDASETLGLQKTDFLLWCNSGNQRKFLQRIFFGQFSENESVNGTKNWEKIVSTLCRFGIETRLLAQRMIPARMLPARMLPARMLQK